LIGISFHPNGSEAAQITYYRRATISVLSKVISQALQSEAENAGMSIVSINNLMVVRPFTPFDWREIRSPQDAARVLKWFRTCDAGGLVSAIRRRV
jgi:predicted xylose isomerase-like sugar epimerase